MNILRLNTLNDDKVIIKKGGGNSGGGNSGGEDMSIFNKYFAKNDVDFFDIDGSLLYSYSWEEIVANGELPPLPEREGLICQEWNYSFDYIQQKKAKYTVGATYITEDGSTQLFIELTYPTLLSPSILFQQSEAQGVLVDWGDGNTEVSDIVNADIVLTHRYDKVGRYVIKLLPNDTCQLTLGNNNSNSRLMSPTYKPSGVSGVSATNTGAYMRSLYQLHIGKNVNITQYSIRNTSVKLISIPKDVTYSGGVFYAFSAPCVIVPMGRYVGATDFFSNTSIDLICLSQSCQDFGNRCFNYSGVKSFTTPRNWWWGSQNTLPTYSNNLLELFMNDVSTYRFSDMSNRLQLLDHSYNTAVSSLSATAVLPEDCKIVVPDALYDEWVNATNWAAHASKIVKVSEYKNKQL